VEGEIKKIEVFWTPRHENGMYSPMLRQILESADFINSAMNFAEFMKSAIFAVDWN